MEMFEFTIEERRSLIGLIDLAVKAGGLQVAQTAVHFQQKLSAPSGIRTSDHPAEKEGQEPSRVALAAEIYRTEMARRNRKRPPKDS